MIDHVKKIYLEILKAYLGLRPGTKALGGVGLDKARPGTLSEELGWFFKSIVSGTDITGQRLSGKYRDRMMWFYRRIKGSFVHKYASHKKNTFFNNHAMVVLTEKDPESLGRAIAELWSPEIAYDLDKKFKEWQLSKVKPNKRPIKPTQVMIQLNALYGPPDLDSLDVPKSLENEYDDVIKDPGKKIAAYDHPVPLFAPEEEHELIKCLMEMDRDIEFEKSKKVLPRSRTMPVLISISTTHEKLDTVAEKWLKSIIKSIKLKHITCYLLSENNARRLDKLLGNKAEIFTVTGKYACHFGALKYAQLIFGRAMGIRAGFKLDTDEGMMSRNLYKTTRKTWLQTLCHSYWGGKAVNFKGKEVYLGFNIGEYVDSRDIGKLGYKKAMRTPEVKPVKSYLGPFVLFPKHINQAQGTALFNRTKKLRDFISHPLVKGGGYGVDNEALRKYHPFGFSKVGRAEDQQFYFSTLKQGLVGIFHPDLRIIHYKEAVKNVEHKHMVGTVVADLYRMLLFKFLMDMLGVKKEADPFPGCYAGDLIRAQVFFCWLYLVFSESAKGNEDLAREFLEEGLNELIPLIKEQDRGEIKAQFQKEKAAWKSFTDSVRKMDKAKAGKWVESLRI
jgi:hypothetical protein